MDRRSLLRSLIAAPAIIAYDRLMPVKLFVPDPALYIDCSNGVVRAEGVTYTLSAWVKHNAVWQRIGQVVPPGEPLRLELPSSKQGVKLVQYSALWDTEAVADGSTTGLQVEVG